MTQLFLDLSSLARWSGPPVGIARVEHALARAAARRPGTVPVVLHRNRFHALQRRWLDAITGWSAVLDDEEAPSRRGWRARVPSRAPVVNRLERWRLTAPRALAVAADLAQRAVLAPKAHGTPLWDAAGRRIARVPPDLALGPEVRPGAGDVVFSAGSGWAHGDPAEVARLKARDGFRYALLCYDLIPVTHPTFWLPTVSEALRTYWLAALPLADLVVANARCIADDLERLARNNAIPPPATAVLPLGYDPPPRATGRLPDGLEAGRYALFVSTIEPRKGHATLLRAWRALLDRGVPQRHGFRMVFVGREGWMVEEVMRSLAGEDWGDSVRHLRGVDGPRLDALYEGAAFCLYPSAYEGFGLPIIEAFARGKAVLASDGGAVPETVGGLSPTLPAGDAAAWEAALADWITDPAARAPWERRVAEGFAHPDWRSAADAILDAVARIGSAGASAQSGP